MTSTDPRVPLQVGELAPDFTLPTVPDEGFVSLADYRGRSPVLLVMLRGLDCPFCRRRVVQLGGTCEKLQGAGVETLVIVEDATEPMRLYYRLRPVRVPLASDPDRTTYHAFGLPTPGYTPESVDRFRSTRIKLDELPEPMSVVDAVKALRQMDPTRESDEAKEVRRQIKARDFMLFGAHYLLDRDGIVRWASIECAQEGVTNWEGFPLATGGFVDYGTFPTDDELLAAARTVQ